MPCVLAIHPHLLSLEVQPNREWNANDYSQPSKQGVTATVSKSGKHLFSEEREGETEE